MPKQLRLLVHFNSGEDSLILIIEDNGRGFDQKLAQSQSGMGLTSMSERVENIGGNLSIQSESGSGTKISVSIPLNAKDQTSSDSTGGAFMTNRNMQSETIRILITDDHAVVREGLRTFINTEPGMEVVGEAVDGIEAVQQACELKPDVILMDMEMPRMGGLEAIQKIKENVRKRKFWY